MLVRPSRAPLPLFLPRHSPPGGGLPLPHLPPPPLLPRAPPPRAQVPLLLLIRRRPFSHATAEDDRPLVDTLCSIVSDLFASDRNMEAVLDRSGLAPSASAVARVLHRFRHAHRPAYRFFRWAGSRSGYAHDEAAYCKMLDVLGSTRQLETMAALLEEMGKVGMLSQAAFRVAVRAFASAREFKKAVAVFALAESHNLHVGTEEFNGMLLALAEEKMAREAHGLFDRMKHRYQPDLRTYTILLSGWCKLKNLVEAGKLWNEMVDRGMKPDIVTHNIMLQGLIRGQRQPEAIKLYELMKVKGPRPTACTYNILIEDFCKHKKLERAVACFQEMIADGCAPDSVTFTSLVMGFGKRRKMHEVTCLLKEMKERNCPPDGKMFNTIIKIMTNQDMNDDAVKVYKKMIKDGIMPTIHTFNMLLKSYSRANDHEMCCAVWEEMEKRGVCPDNNSYTVLIGGLVRQRRSVEALKYIEEMVTKGMKAPYLDYHKLAVDISRSGTPYILNELAHKTSLSGRLAASEVFKDLAQRMERGNLRKGSGPL